MLSENYRLLDFGNARKLEQFGPVILDRPCPAAEEFNSAALNLWPGAAIRLPVPTNAQPAQPLPDPWRVRFSLDRVKTDLSLQFQLKITPFGHVGVFPEQLSQWLWLFHTTTEYRALGVELDANSPSKLKALNLFAYTGGSTLALALAGAEVVHVDASAPSVAWARGNAQLNNLENHPIRWIVEDARKFVQREIRRGSIYDIVVLDPPSYGHGPSGKSWELALEWEELLTGCIQLLKNSPRAQLLWTGHSEEPPAENIVELIAHGRHLQIESGRSALTDINGRTLDAGYYVRAFSPAGEPI